jgi:hypothetical protein
MSDTSIKLPTIAIFAQSCAKGVKRAASWIRTVWAGLAAVIAAYGQAMEMAHVAPFLTPVGKREPGTDDLPDGRDPSW